MTDPHNAPHNDPHNDPHDDPHDDPQHAPAGNLHDLQRTLPHALPDSALTTTPRILVVDDEAHIVQVLSLKLRNAGYEVTTASDGEEALDLVMRQGSVPPHLIITDFQMPYMTGLELCKALAKEPSTAGIPVLMLTARGHALDDQDLTLGNIRDVLSKPFSPRAIVEQVRQLIGVGSAAASVDAAETWRTVRSEVA